MFDFFNGILVGLAVSAPLGPIGMLCLNYAFSHGFRLAVLAGLGAAVADVFYAAISGFGLTFLNEWLVEHYFIFGLFGGSFLIFLGYKIFISKPAERAVSLDASTEFQAFLSTLLFTLSNPLTLVAFATLFGCLTATEGVRTNFDTAFLIAGVFSGSMLWWTTLAFAGSTLRSKINAQVLTTIRKVAGAGIMGFGAFFILYNFR